MSTAPEIHHMYRRQCQEIISKVGGEVKIRARFFKDSIRNSTKWKVTHAHTYRHIACNELMNLH